MRTKGKIASWHADKGFGFISPNNGGERVFVHIKAFNSRLEEPKINQVVSYDLSCDKQGRVCADGVRRLGDKPATRNRHMPSSKTTFCCVLFLFIVAISSLLGQVHILFLAFYIVVSLLTFLIYAMDKSAAKRGGWRTKESSLHLLALFGGWPGAAIAQQKLRHKSKKESFRVVFWLTVAINISCFTWLHSPNGQVFSQLLSANIG